MSVDLISAILMRSTVHQPAVCLTSFMCNACYSKIADKQTLRGNCIHGLGVQLLSSLPSFFVFPHPLSPLSALSITHFSPSASFSLSFSLLTPLSLSRSLSEPLTQGNSSLRLLPDCWPRLFSNSPVGWSGVRGPDSRSLSRSLDPSLSLSSSLFCHPRSYSHSLALPKNTRFSPDSRVAALSFLWLGNCSVGGRTGVCAVTPGVSTWPPPLNHTDPCLTDWPVRGERKLWAEWERLQPVPLGLMLTFDLGLCKVGWGMGMIQGA